MEKKKFKRRLTGIVVSDKADKTVVVKVNRRYQHGLYGKFVNKSKKYHVHDENNSAQMGERVMIIEAKPYSKLKKWELYKKA